MELILKETNMQIDMVKNMDMDMDMDTDTDMDMDMAHLITQMTLQKKNLYFKK